MDSWKTIEINSRYGRRKCKKIELSITIYLIFSGDIRYTHIDAKKEKEKKKETLSRNVRLIEAKNVADLCENTCSIDKRKH